MPDPVAEPTLSESAVHSQTAQHFKPLDVRQHDIQHDNRVFAGERTFDSTGAVVRGVTRQPFSTQILRQQLTVLRLGTLLL
jgi:hypothetical protein